MKTLADINPKSGEWYSVISSKGGKIRSVALIDKNRTIAIMAYDFERYIAELFDPQKLTFEEAKLAVEKEIENLQIEYRDEEDTTSAYILEIFLRDTRKFYEEHFS